MPTASSRVSCLASFVLSKESLTTSLKVTNYELVLFCLRMKFNVEENSKKESIIPEVSSTQPKFYQTLTLTITRR